MKRILTIILLIASTNSYAEWTQINFTDDFIIYVDKATIRRNGNFVKMWDLRDYKRVQKVEGVSFLSSKFQNEYDCKEEKVRILAISWFSGQMGNGKVVYNDSDTGDKWSPISPDSIGETIWKVACGKK